MLAFGNAVTELEQLPAYQQRHYPMQQFADAAILLFGIVEHIYFLNVCRFNQSETRIIASS